MSQVSQLLKSFEDGEYRDLFLLALLRRSVAYQIREARRARSLTQVGLAEASGMPQSTISNLEGGGEGGYTVRTLVRVAAGLGMAVTVRFQPLEEMAETLLATPPQPAGRAASEGA